MKYKKANDLIENLLLYEFRECSGADPENSESGVPANDAKIVRSRDAQCNTEESP